MKIGKATWQFGISTDKGPVKKTNEDRTSLDIIENGQGIQGAIAVVADGMGGYQAGDVASRVAVEMVMDWWLCRVREMPDHPFSFFRKGLNERLFEINQTLLAIGCRENVRLGTTLSALLLFEGNYMIFHVGDSRIYRKTNGIMLTAEKETAPLGATGIMQLTEDHSWVQAQVSLGRITKEQARRHSKRNVLLQCLGVNHHLNVFYKSGRYAPNDLFLLCSDGFHTSFSDEQVSLMMQKFEDQDLQLVSDHLVRSASLAGATDNVSVILIRNPYAPPSPSGWADWLKKGLKRYSGG